MVFEENQLWSTKAFMPEGVAFDFIDSHQGADISFFPFPGSGSLTYVTRVK